ncbi:hypothetical protein ACNI65_06540 [Roseateles sp. So40a]|uniref:hypothetical protein n=1 Tax=Roseateles sp. So40a TaxID=3400226 RepID=UPI003A8BA121
MFTFDGRDIEFISTLDASLARHLPENICVLLSGAPDCSVVTVGLEGGFVCLNVSHPGVDYMRRQLFFSSNGEIDLHNQRIRLHTTARGQGFLARSVSRQLEGIETLSVQGNMTVSSFSTVVVAPAYANQNDSRAEPDIGYWLLPQLGFDSPCIIPGTLTERFPRASPKSLVRLLQERDIQDWWFDAGRSASFSLKFSLEPGSLSRQVLRDYTTRQSNTNGTAL